MTLCRRVQRWFTETITRNVYDWAERAEEQCEEARRWVEREIREPIERRRERTVEKCKRRKCKWYCACCNKWFCWLETIVEIVVEWVVRVVGEWLVETVCKTVVKLVKVLVDVITTVVRFAVSFFVCIPDPRGWLDNLIDLWTDITNIVRQAGDLVDYLWGAVNELIDITIESLLDLAGRFGILGFFIAIVAGLLDIIRRLSEHLRQTVTAWIDAIADLLTLNFCGFGLNIGRGAVGLGLGVLDVINVVGLGSGKVVEWAMRDSVRERIRNRLEQDVPDAALRARYAAGIRLEAASFGAPWEILPRRLSVHSRSKGIDLRQMHRDGTLNLYDIAGYTFFCADRNRFTGGQWMLAYEGGERPVIYSDLRAYIEDGRDAAPDFELVSTTREKMNATLRLTRRKYRQLGLELFWDHQARHRIDDMAFFFLPERRSCSLQGPAEPLVNDILGFTPSGDTAYRCSLPDRPAYCRIPFAEVFSYETDRFGVASVNFLPDAQRLALQTAAPDPFCVANHAGACQPQAGDVYNYHADRNVGATWRSARPEGVTGLVPAHELGHCFGLEHEGHSGVENIMFTPNESQGLEPVTVATVITYLMVNTEANFTINDADRTWQWILLNAQRCLPQDDPFTDDALDGFF